MPIEVRAVQSHRDKRIFMTFPWQHYKTDPLWVPPMLPQRRNRFEPAKNPFISGGGVKAFIAWQGNTPAGTIVLAVDENRNKAWDENNAAFGYFECIEDYHVAEALFDTAAAWTKDQGKARLWGPWHLDYEDSHGFLLGEWDRPPIIMNGHTPAYYAEYAECYGFQKARRDSLAFCYDLAQKGIPEKLARVARKIQTRGKITIRQADFSRWDEEIDNATDILNRGLAVLETRGFWNAERMTASVKDLRPILDPAFVLFAEIDGRGVGLAMGLPDLNEAIKKANGMRYPWNALQMVLALRHQPRAVTLKSVAVDPQYWNRGVDAVLFYQFGKNALERGYEWIDLSLTGEDNPMTPRMALNLGFEEYKRYRIYELQGW